MIQSIKENKWKYNRIKWKLSDLPKLAAYLSKGTASTSGVVSTTAKAAESPE